MAVLEHMPTAVIMRPSIVFGPEDDFFNRFAGMSRMGPVLPVVGADTKFQPVFVDDVAAAVVVALDDITARGVYELGGPDVASFRELMQTMLRVVHRNRIIANIPFFMARAMAAGFGGLLGAAAADVLRLATTDTAAFGTVFLAEAALFLASAVMAARIMDGARAPSLPSQLVPGE